MRRSETYTSARPDPSISQPDGGTALREVNRVGELAAKLDDVRIWVGRRLRRPTGGPYTGRCYALFGE